MINSKKRNPPIRIKNARSVVSLTTLTNPEVVLHPGVLNAVRNGEEDDSKDKESEEEDKAEVIPPGVVLVRVVKAAVVHSFMDLELKPLKLPQVNLLGRSLDYL